MTNIYAEAFFAGAADEPTGWAIVGMFEHMAEAKTFAETLGLHPERTRSIRGAHDGWVVRAARDLRPGTSGQVSKAAFTNFRDRLAKLDVAGYQVNWRAAWPSCNYPTREAFEAATAAKLAAPVEG